MRLLLDKGADVNARTKKNMSALSTAAGMGSEDIVKILLDRLSFYVCEREIGLYTDSQIYILAVAQCVARPSSKLTRSHGKRRKGMPAR